MNTLNATTHINASRWETVIPIVDVHVVRSKVVVASTGAPPERSGAAIVDEFAEDLRLLADS
jgi:hypothetical protein